MASTGKFVFAVLCTFLVGSSVNAHAEWNYRIAPYLWVASLDGTTKTAGKEVDFKADFGDLISFVDAGVAARYEAKSDSWGYFLDGFFIKLSADSDRQVGAIKVTNDQKIVEAGLSYALSEQLSWFSAGVIKKLIRACHCWLLVI